GNLVSPRQLTDKGADMQTKEGVTRIITSGGQVAATARYRLRVLCLDLKPWPASNGTAVVVACNGMAAAAACNGMAAAMSCKPEENEGAASLTTYAVGTGTSCGMLALGMSTSMQ
ncbi:unnamed protein product, partial [Closterium sp. NIES-53]